ncbi:MAG: SCO6745 family protein [Dermatophilaceae bacterium]
MDPVRARVLWQLFETVHDVTYFCAEPSAAGRELGYRGFWMAYFAFRAAPLGACEPAVVAATCFGFPDAQVRRALPDAWTYAGPADALAARRSSAAAALRRMWRSAGLPLDQVAQTADDLWEVSQRCSDHGRPLGAANRALPGPEDPVERLWQATTTLREHRGDGHVAVLVARGIAPLEAHLLKSRSGDSDEASLKRARGWPEEAWAGAEAQLTHRGLLRQGRLTTRGRKEHDEVERATDRCAVQPWAHLPDAHVEQLRERLTPLAEAVIANGEVPPLNPVGLGARPDSGT